jgi:hypothetical protein
MCPCSQEEIKTKKGDRLDAMVHAYNPSYSEDRDWEDHSPRAAQAKSQRDPISGNKLGVVVHVCFPN